MEAEWVALSDVWSYILFCQITSKTLALHKTNLNTSQFSMLHPVLQAWTIQDDTVIRWSCGKTFNSEVKSLVMMVFLSPAEAQACLLLFLQCPLLLVL